MGHRKVQRRPPKPKIRMDRQAQIYTEVGLPEGMKTCAQCKTPKALEEFYTAKNGRPVSYCKTCSNKNVRAWQIKNTDRIKGKLRKRVDRNRRVIVAHLMKNPCVDCGCSDIRVLDFDHVSGEKIKPVSTMVSGGASVESLKAEIKKCEIRCRNCHKIATGQRAGWWRSRDLFQYMPCQE